jgi:hypothetical protein
VLTPIHGTWRLNSIVCAYCGQSMDFIPESGREEAIQIVSAHEAICEQNPLVQKLCKAEELLQEMILAAKPYTEREWTHLLNGELEQEEAKLVNACEHTLEVYPHFLPPKETP